MNGRKAASVTDVTRRLLLGITPPDMSRKGKERATYIDLSNEDEIDYAITETRGRQWNAEPEKGFYKPGPMEPKHLESRCSFACVRLMIEFKIDWFLEAQWNGRMPIKIAENVQHRIILMAVLKKNDTVVPDEGFWRHREEQIKRDLGRTAAEHGTTQMLQIRALQVMLWFAESK